MRKTGCRGWLAGGLLCGLLLCGLTVVVPVDVEAAAVTTVYDGQSPVEEKELLRFLDVLPQFRSWARENRIEAHPVARRGKADFLYPDDAARWVEAKGWDARRLLISSSIFSLISAMGLGSSRNSAATTIQGLSSMALCR